MSIHSIAIENLQVYLTAVIYGCTEMKMMDIKADGFFHALFHILFKNHHTIQEQC